MGERGWLNSLTMSQAGGEAGCGFNARLMGETYSDATANIRDGRRYGERAAGWNLADGMARKGKLYAIHNFHHSHECSGHAFPYGGKFVCETCTWPGYPDLRKDWWAIKCYPDGNAWCCVGLDFEDLQASDNYAFADTYEGAIKAYGDLMVAKATPTGEASDV